MGIWGYFAAPKAPRKFFGVKHQIFWPFFREGVGGGTPTFWLRVRGGVLPKSPRKEKRNKVSTAVVKTTILRIFTVRKFFGNIIFYQEIFEILQNVQPCSTVHHQITSRYYSFRNYLRRKENHIEEDPYRFHRIASLFVLCIRDWFRLPAILFVILVE